MDQGEGQHWNGSPGNRDSKPAKIQVKHGGAPIAVSGPLIANEFSTLLGAATDGMGLAQVPRPIAASALDSAALVDVLTAFAPTTPGVFLTYPARHQMMPKLRAFVDHVKSRLGMPGDGEA